MNDDTYRRWRRVLRRTALATGVITACCLVVASRVGDASLPRSAGAWPDPAATTVSRASDAGWTPTAAKAGFAVAVKGETSRYRSRMLTVLPGETEIIQVVGPADARAFAVRASTGRMRVIDATTWEWHAPSVPGTYSVSIVEPRSGDSIRLTAFVLVPLDRVKGGWLNGYRVGRYPERALRGLAVYERPRGFIEVTAENVDSKISPHFRLRQFLCKQESGYPKYVVLHERLLLKLEYLLERVNEAGYPASSFHVLSGYRTPYYNEAIGNVRYSGHVYGLAADIFVDERPRDGMMDDLNGDSRFDVRDATVLYDLVDSQVGHPEYEGLIGGLGRYRKTPAHGPFIHVDVRGFRARW
jgi:hypothetical protein